MNEEQSKSVNWHKVFMHEFRELNLLEKGIRIIIVLFIAYVILSIFFTSDDMEFYSVEIDGTHEQFILGGKYVRIIRKVANDQVLTQKEITTLKENVSRRHAEIAFNVLRMDYYKDLGMDGIGIKLSTTAQAEEFVNDVYGYQW